MDSSVKPAKYLQKVIHKGRNLKTAWPGVHIIPSEGISLSTEYIGSLKLGNMSALSSFSPQDPTSCIFFVCSSWICNSVALYSECRVLRMVHTSGSFPLQAIGWHVQYWRVVFLLCGLGDALDDRKLRAQSTLAETATDIPWGSFSQCRGVLFSTVFSFALFSHLTLSFCLLCLIPPFLCVYWLWIKKLRLV